MHHRFGILKRFLWVLAGVAVAASGAVAADYGMRMAETQQLWAAAEPGLSSDPDDLSDLGTSGSLVGMDAVGHTAASAPESIERGPGAGFTRLPGHVLASQPQAALLDPSSAAALRPASARSNSVTLTFVFKRDDPAGFERYLKDVYDPGSSQYRRFLPQRTLTKRFGPSREDYEQTRRYLQRQGLHVERESNNRITLTMRGPRPAVERALRVKLQDYSQGDRTFYAASTDPALPDGIASHVLAIEGLSTLAMPQPAIKGVSLTVCQAQQAPNGKILVNSSYSKKCVKVTRTVIPLFANILCALALITAGGAANAASGGAAFYAGAAATGGGLIWNSVCPFTNLGNNYNNFLGAAGSGVVRTSTAMRAAGEQPKAVLAGAGQKVGLLEFDTFRMSDVSDYLALTGAPASSISNLSVVPVNGGVASPGSGESEVLMDIDTLMALAPGAKVAVYDAPFGGHAADYSTLFNAMINDGVTVISNSWASCEDQVSQAEAAAIDAVLQTAAASGISVFNGTGDSGSTCLDGSANTISVPADSPNATAVGGTSLPNGFGQGGTYNGESWWDGSGDTPATGQGGFGVSRYFIRPSYQNGLNSNSMRSVPDVAILADPEYGIIICQQDNGGCPNGMSNGGTSLAAPEWAALAAALNQAQGKNLGSYNALLYPLAATDAFHSAASMSSDFQHVGLGSPNTNVINRLLNGQVVGVPVAANSTAHAMPPEINATFHSDASFTIPADGATPGGVFVSLMDAHGNTVSGKTVSLTAQSGSAIISASSGASSVSGGTVTFTVTDLAAETVTFTPTDTTDGLALPTVSLTFGVPPAASAGMTANPATVAADGQTPATITVTLTDSLNRPAPGKTVTISNGGAHAVVTGPTPAVTDSNGQIQFTAVDQVNEAVTFTAVDVTDGNLPVPGSGTVTYSGSTNTACGVGVAPVAAPGYTVSSYVTGFPAASTVFYQNVNFGCPGANNPAFTSGGTVLLSDFFTGAIYRTGLDGGAVTSTNILNTIGVSLGGLVYGKDGSLYATQGGGNGQIIQIDPATGATLRVVASGLICPAGLSVDPLSGDLFFDDQCTGAGDDNASIFRVIDPANTDSSRPTSVVVYATLPTTPNGGMAFAPNGTLYAVSGYYNTPTAQVEQVSGTNASTVSVTPVTGVTSDYAVAIGVTNPDGSARSLIVQPNGTLSDTPIANPSAATTIATGAPGVGVTGPDGCLYSAHYDTVYRIANSTGGCNFAPTSPAPYLTLSAGTSGPLTGSAEVLTAVVHNVSQLSGVPVAFSITGRNLQSGIAQTDATGTAKFTYTSPLAGGDVALASAPVNNGRLFSKTATYTWGAGQDVTMVSLNPSPQGVTINQPVTVAASLTDLSLSSPTAIAGQSITFSSGGDTCTAATTSTGTASCVLTPTQPGLRALTATFAGTSHLASNTASIGFTVSAAVASSPAPTVTISVNPTTVAPGSPATLTWSSTNATACTAGGGWSGDEATSGTQTVTPTANGSYTYNLSCSGPGGTGIASAVLSAGLVAVTVTAKSGGGALSWYLVLSLGVLVMLRFRALHGQRLVISTRRRRGGRVVGMSIVGILLAVASVHTVRADQSAAADRQATPLDPFYVGIRVGSMLLRQDSSKISQGLTGLGFDGVTASSDTSGPAGTVFLGYEFTQHAGIELGYTYRSSTAAHLSGTIPSAAGLTPLLEGTTGLIRGYGNIVSLSYSGRFELLPRFSLEPRIGGFFWATKVVATGLDDRVDATHEGGGFTAGVTAAYRVWRGLELGVSIDHYRGFPSNIATLYAGSLEWRFGPT